MRSETFPLGDGLAALAEAEFGAGNRAMQYLQTSLISHDFDRDAAFALLSAGQGRSGESWMERGLALLFLENQLLRLAPDDLTEFDLILVGLGLKPETGCEVPMRASVLQEGFSTISLPGFVIELIRRLRRLSRVH